MVTESDQPRAGGGINFTEVRSPLRPPGSENDQGEEQPRGAGWGFPEESQELPSGTVPLSGNAIKLPLKAIGNMAAELTQFPGWRFSDEELEAFAEAMEELGLRLPKLANAIVVCGGIVAVKGMGYIVWARAGKPSPTGRAGRPTQAEGSRFIGAEDSPNGVANDEV